MVDRAGFESPAENFLDSTNEHCRPCWCGLSGASCISQGEIRRKGLTTAARSPNARDIVDNLSCCACTLLTAHQVNATVSRSINTLRCCGDIPWLREKPRNGPHIENMMRLPNWLAQNIQPVNLNHPAKGRPVRTWPTAHMIIERAARKIRPKSVVGRRPLTGG